MNYAEQESEHIKSTIKLLNQKIDSYLSLNPDGVEIDVNLMHPGIVIKESEYDYEIVKDILGGLIRDGFCFNAGKNTHNNNYWIHFTFNHLYTMLHEKLPSFEITYGITDEKKQATWNDNRILSL